MSASIIRQWNPEDPVFWKRQGEVVARRNLWVSIPALALSFAVWMLWSVVVVHLPAAGFRYSTNQLFWLVALPALGGTTLRLFLGFATPAFGGRRWTLLATAALLLPGGVAAVAVLDTTTPYEAWVALSLLCGLGGGLACTVVTTGGPGSGFGAQAQVLRSRHAWRLAWLSLGGFGSFVGLSLSFPLLAALHFPDLEAHNATGLGPLLGMLALAVGHRLASRHGAARVSCWAFMALAASAAVAATRLADVGTAGSLPAFAGTFAALFACSGLAIGGTWRLLPAVFLAEHRRHAEPTPAALEGAAHAARHEARAALGFGSAIGAYGGFLVPKAFGTSIALTSGAQGALWALFAFTLSCIAVTWWHYGRHHAPMPC